MGDPRHLKLLLRTPAELVLDTLAYSVVAEDASGRFGLRPGCEPLLVALVPSLITYRTEPDGPESYVAVARGFLFVSKNEVQIAVRTAIPCTSLESVRADLVNQAKARKSGERATQRAFQSLESKLLIHLAGEERLR